MPLLMAGIGATARCWPRGGVLGGRLGPSGRWEMGSINGAGSHMDGNAGSSASAWVPGSPRVVQQASQTHGSAGAWHACGTAAKSSLAPSGVLNGGQQRDGGGQNWVSKSPENDLADS